MLLQERIKHIQNLERQVGVIKKLVEEYLANTDEPLDERWQLYQELPSFLRNHDCCQRDFLIKTDGSFIELCDVGEYAKYELIQVHSFLENKARSLLDHSLDTVATKEYILKHNLGSFENDW